MMQQILGVPAFAISYLISRAVARRRNRRQAVPDAAPGPKFNHTKECRVDVVTDDGINRIDIDVHYDDPAAACAALHVLGTDMLPTFAHEIGACQHGGDPS
ncbi:hypothetical protein ACXYTP_23555 [Tsukamurella ocularis]